MRAGMRGLAGMAVVGTTLLAGVPTASAGTYDVLSCGAPGAGGINRAWRAEAGGFDNPSANPPVHVAPDPASYVIS